MLVDSHCHLDRLNYGDIFKSPEEVLAAAKAAGVNHVLCVCVSLTEFPAMKQIMAPFDEVSLSCGMHPLHMDEAFGLDDLLSLANDEKVVAIGETGLDYLYDKDSKEQQKKSFIEHIDVAKKLNKPLIIHTRGAKADTLSILKEHNADQVGGGLHCFTEDLEMAQEAMKMGFYISASGIISFHSAADLRKVFAELPMDRMLVETDSPWLAPAPHRGEENQPAYTRRVAEVLAEVKGLTLDEVAKITTDNYFRLFNRAQR